ncbi:hypothetical protein FDB44_17250 [Clostridium botulinum]|uniref:hypothetical protein n=1 Tax=Clostridium botulinum TaxID=1491 RepID=UPI0013F03729|nr:hypothetical protein [Clostridium botulinum]MBY6934824.1 hypothetical protein [Clostridium botulinum]NFL83620.1 hypothetical protein [Clostridium botulinum]NFN11879.1 hypothetical protein [Clostridium botulinum]NFO36659.1 hypothetical protein [Clostridium botulinum]NFO45267.1 hypothetical protein [Clostridium botulinum]
MEYICPMPKKIKPVYGIMIYLSNIHKRYCRLQDRKIIFDFTYTKFIEKDMLAVLGLVFVKLKSQRNKIYLRGLSREQREELIEFGFISGMSDKKNEKNYISYDSFDGDNEKGFRTYLNNEIKNIENKEISKYIISHIMEVFLNIRPHARGKVNKNKFGNKEVFSSGFFDKDKHELIMSICNNGKTFAQNIQQKTLIEYTNEWEYIRWALEECNSTTSGRPGGAGLAMVKEIIIKYKGKLTICSGKAYYSIYFDNQGNKIVEKKDLNTFFPATAVVIKIITDKIDEIYVDKTEEFSISDLVS